MTFEGKNYRVLTREHNAYLEMCAIWAVFWYLFTLSLLGSSLILLFSLKVLFPFMQLPFILVACFCSHLLFTIYVFRKRAHFTNSIFYTSLNLLIWMIPVMVLAFMEIKQILIPLCFYRTFFAIKSLLRLSCQWSTWAIKAKWSPSFSSWCKRWWLLWRLTKKFSLLGETSFSVMSFFSYSCPSVLSSWRLT